MSSLHSFSTSRDQSLAGSIWYLPYMSDFERRKLGQERADRLPHEGAFDHPVLVLSHGKINGDVSILILTTFGGQSLHKRHQTNSLRRAEYLPISPSDRHPNSNSLLLLEDGSQMNKPSYVNIKSVYEVPFSWLKRYRALHNKGTRDSLYLTQESYEELIQTRGMFEPWTDHSIPARDTVSPEDTFQGPPEDSRLQDSLPEPQEVVSDSYHNVNADLHTEIDSQPSHESAPNGPLGRVVEAVADRGDGDADEVLDGGDALAENPAFDHGGVSPPLCETQQAQELQLPSGRNSLPDTRRPQAMSTRCYGILLILVALAAVFLYSHEWGIVGLTLIFAVVALRRWL